jgi:hypothetical protein
MSLTVENVVGPFEFGLSSKGELLRLFEAFGTLVDYVEYSNDAPWPVKPDGEVRSGPIYLPCNISASSVLVLMS